MADSTSNLDLIASSQASPEITANQALNAASPATYFARRESASSGLTWGFYGGVISITGTPTRIANGTLALTASTTNYVEQDPATGTVSSNTSGWTGGYTRLYTVVTGTSSVTSYSDWRL